MRKQNPRTYKTEARAKKYARELSERYPGKTFSVMTDPRHGSFRFVVAYLIDRDNAPVQWALCA